MWQARLRSDKHTVPGLSPGPQHSAAALTDKIQRKLAASLDFEDFTSTYKAKMRVYGQVSALDTEESNVTYTGTQDRGREQPRYGDRVPGGEGSDDYAEPHAVLSTPARPRALSPPEQIYQSVSVPGPVISHSSLSSPGSSLDLAPPRAIYSTCTNLYQQPTYQKIKKARNYQRSSSQNIYQSVNNCHSLSKVETYDSRAIPTSAKIEVKLLS